MIFKQYEDKNFLIEIASNEEAFLKEFIKSSGLVVEHLWQNEIIKTEAIYNLLYKTVAYYNEQIKSMRENNYGDDNVKIFKDNKKQASFFILNFLCTKEKNADLVFSKIISERYDNKSVMNTLINYQLDKNLILSEDLEICYIDRVVKLINKIILNQSYKKNEYSNRYYGINKFNIKNIDYFIKKIKEINLSEMDFIDMVNLVKDTSMTIDKSAFEKINKEENNKFVLALINNSVGWRQLDEELKDKILNLYWENSFDKNRNELDRVSLGAKDYSVPADDEQKVIDFKDFLTKNGLLEIENRTFYFTNTVLLFNNIYKSSKGDVYMKHFIQHFSDIFTIEEKNIIFEECLFNNLNKNNSIENNANNAKIFNKFISKEEATPFAYFFLYAGKDISKVNKAISYLEQKRFESVGDKNVEGKIDLFEKYIIACEDKAYIQYIFNDFLKTGLFSYKLRAEMLSKLFTTLVLSGGEIEYKGEKVLPEIKMNFFVKKIKNVMFNEDNLPLTLQINEFFMPTSGYLYFEEIYSKMDVWNRVPLIGDAVYQRKIEYVAEILVDNPHLFGVILHQTYKHFQAIDIVQLSKLKTAINAVIGSVSNFDLELLLVYMTSNTEHKMSQFLDVINLLDFELANRKHNNISVDKTVVLSDGDFLLTDRNVSFEKIALLFLILETELVNKHIEKLIKNKNYEMFKSIFKEDTLSIIYKNKEIFDTTIEMLKEIDLFEHVKEFSKYHLDKLNSNDTDIDIAKIFQGNIYDSSSFMIDKDLFTNILIKKNENYFKDFLLKDNILKIDVVELILINNYLNQIQSVDSNIIENNEHIKNMVLKVTDIKVFSKNKHCEEMQKKSWRVLFEKLPQKYIQKITFISKEEETDFYINFLLREVFVEEKNSSKTYLNYSPRDVYYYSIISKDVAENYFIKNLLLLEATRGYTKNFSEEQYTFLDNNIDEINKRLNTKDLLIYFNNVSVNRQSFLESSLKNVIVEASIMVDHRVESLIDMNLVDKCFNYEKMTLIECINGLVTMKNKEIYVSPHIFDKEGFSNNIEQTLLYERINNRFVCNFTSLKMDEIGNDLDSINFNNMFDYFNILNERNIAKSIFNPLKMIFEKIFLLNAILINEGEDKIEDDLLVLKKNVDFLKNGYFQDFDFQEGTSLERLIGGIESGDTIFDKYIRKIKLKKKMKKDDFISIKKKKV